MRGEAFRAREVDVLLEGQAVLRGLNLKLFRGEVLGVFGTFDSGKTTLLKLIAGEVSPAAGHLFYAGEPADSPDAPRPAVARIGGSSTLVDGMSIWENLLALGNHRRWRVINPLHLRRVVAVFFREYGIGLAPETRVGDLSVFQKFLLELLKARMQSARIILIDDFTLDCTLDECTVLKALLARLCQEGVSVLMTTSQIAQLKLYTHRIAFLNQGKSIKTVENKPQNYAVIEGLLASLFPQSGREARPVWEDRAQAGAVALSVRGLDARLAEPVSFDLRRGEVAAIVDPSKLVLDALREALLFGGGPGRGEVLCGGRPARPLNTRRVRDGLVFVDHGALDLINEAMTPLENICMGVHRRVSRLGFVKPGSLRFVEREFAAWYGSDGLVRRTHCRQLSKGERMALVLFRLRLLQPRVVILRSLTIDTDLITYSMLADCLMELARNGAAICVMNANIERIVDFAHRYLVTTRHRLVFDVPFNQIRDTLEWR